ncbi:MAG: NUDIX domain-containing protein [Candidatus Micrarchaeota archaeon]|nr:NUDIX domain-containing protein [Candidatus Micrarchaeota archaeon]
MARLDPEGMVRRLFKLLPKFSTGEINYASSRVAVVVTVFVKHKEKILLVKRSNKVSGYRGKWNAVSGYVDQIRPIGEIALKEIQEEVGIKGANVLRISAGKVYSFSDKNEGKRWIVCPYIVETKRQPKIKLDWENTSYKWIIPEEIAKFEIVPNLDKSLASSLKTLRPE